MGENQNQPFQLLFNASLKVDFQGSRVTSDGGLILIRELDERLVGVLRNRWSLCAKLRFPQRDISFDWKMELASKMSPVGNDSGVAN